MLKGREPLGLIQTLDEIISVENLNNQDSKISDYIFWMLKFILFTETKTKTFFLNFNENKIEINFYFCFVVKLVISR